MQADLGNFHPVDGESSDWEIQCASSVRGWRKAAQKKGLGGQYRASTHGNKSTVRYGETHSEPMSSTNTVQGMHHDGGWILSKRWRPG
jgi:hypothetical protein